MANWNKFTFGKWRINLIEWKVTFNVMIRVGCKSRWIGELMNWWIEDKPWIFCRRQCRQTIGGSDPPRSSVLRLIFFIWIFCPGIAFYFLSIWFGWSVLRMHFIYIFIWVRKIHFGMSTIILILRLFTLWPELRNDKHLDMMWMDERMKRGTESTWQHQESEDLFH